MLKRVIKVVSQVMNVPADGISPESSPDTIGAWDSLKHMNLVLALEEEFAIAFTDEEIVDLLSVRIIAETLKEKGAGLNGRGERPARKNGRKGNV